MVQPYNYSLNVPSPQESFLTGLQVAQRQQQIRTERDQIAAQAAAEQAKIDRANQYALRAKEVAKDPSPEKLNALYAEFREYGADIDRFAKNLTDADKRTYGTILKRAIIAKANGQTNEQISEIYKSGAEAAQNSNRPDIAERMTAAAQMALNPKMNDDFAARSLLNQFSPEDYEIAYPKKYVVAGNNIFTTREIDDAVAESERTGNPNISVKPIIPQGAVSDLKSNPKLAADFDAKYGTPANPNPSAQILGGQTDKPSGTFQGQ